MVRKNTLPYVYQWAVIDTKTGDSVGGYKTQKLAEKGCGRLRRNGLPDDAPGTPRRFHLPGLNDALEAASERMKHPDGDAQPKPRHSSKRKVELD